MIPLEKLCAVTHVISHENCPDGVASAMILKQVLPDARFTFVQHGTPEHADLPAEPGMLFCDMTPPRERAQEFVDAGACVLDHHWHSEDVVRAFGDNGVFADEATEPGVSGAVLALRVADPLAVRGPLHMLATLAGIRDTWQKQDPRWTAACEQAEALRFWPVERLLAARPDDWPGLLEIGRELLKKRLDGAQKLAATSYRFTSVAGTRVALFPTIESSDVADALAESVDLSVGYGYVHATDGTVGLVFSTRSRGDYDAGALCKAHGGGGHTKAAGFRVQLVPEALNPIDVFARLLEAYEAR